MRKLAALLVFVGAAALIAGSITFTNSVAPTNSAGPYTNLGTEGVHPILAPATYKDTISGIVFYIESDGRHVSAIGSDGRILWHRDPFADAHLEFYRTKTPHINYLGKASPHTEAYCASNGLPRVIVINYDTSQFGTLNITNGDFTYGGQN